MGEAGPRPRQRVAGRLRARPAPPPRRWPRAPAPPAAPTSASSRRRKPAQASSSAGAGRLPGGTQRTALLTKAPVQREPVAAGARRRRRGQPGPVERRVEEVARAVAGEHAAGPVGAVGAGGQAEQDERRAGLAEARHRAAPVGLLGVGPPLHAGHLLAPGGEPRAGPAGDDLGGEPEEGVAAGHGEASSSSGVGLPGDFRPGMLRAQPGPRSGFFLGGGAPTGFAQRGGGEAPPKTTTRGRRRCPRARAARWAPCRARCPAR